MKADGVAEGSEPDGRQVPTSNDGALFSGTTYENSSRIQDLHQKYHREIAPDAPATVTSGDGEIGQQSATRGPRTRNISRLMPALDRVNALGTGSDPTTVDFTRTERREALSRDFDNRQPDSGEFLTNISAMKACPQKDISEEWTEKRDVGESPPSTSEQASLTLDPLLESNSTTIETPETDVVADSQLAETREVTSPKTKEPIIVPSEGVTEQEQNLKRTMQLRDDAAAAQEKEEAVRKNEIMIAGNIKELYEDYYGKIDPFHRQAMQTENLSSTLETPVENVTTSISSLATEESQDKPQEVQEGLNSNEHINPSNLQSPSDLAVKHKRQDVADLALAITRLELFLTKVGLIVEKYRTGTQPKTGESMTSSPEEASSLYRILAFDPVTARVDVAETPMSTFETNGEHLHATEILSKLNNPAKFLPYLQKFSEQGYEVVSGGGDMLIFKSSREPSEVRGMSSSMDAVEDHLEELEESSEEHSSSEATASPIPNGPRVRRQEVVFSGGRPQAKVNNKSSDSTKSRGETVTRVLLGGALTAGFCYFVGVVTEMIRGDVEPPRTTGRAGIYSTEDSR